MIVHMCCNSELEVYLIVRIFIEVILQSVELYRFSHGACDLYEVCDYIT